jgi:hypothetical protein
LDLLFGLGFGIIMTLGFGDFCKLWRGLFTRDGTLGAREEPLFEFAFSG